MRSVVAALNSSADITFRLITGDLPLSTLSEAGLATMIKEGVGNPPKDQYRMGQVPTWISPNSMANLKLYHHWNLFNERESLPTFNSLAIESNIGHLDGINEYAVYMNDDLFITNNPINLLDFASPLTGPVIRVQRDLPVTGSNTSGADPAGEWRGMIYSNYLLNERFGRRDRPYLAHILKTMSMPVFQESEVSFYLALFRNRVNIRLPGCLERRVRGYIQDEIPRSWV